MLFYKHHWPKFIDHCIGRRGGGWPSTSYNRQINTSLWMVVEICIPRNFGGSDWTPSYVDYDGR